MEERGERLEESVVVEEESETGEKEKSGMGEAEKVSEIVVSKLSAGIVAWLEPGLREEVGDAEGETMVWEL